MLKINNVLLSNKGEVIKIIKVFKNGYIGIGQNKRGENRALSMLEVERNHYKILI